MSLEIIGKITVNIQVSWFSKKKSKTDFHNTYFDKIFQTAQEICLSWLYINVYGMQHHIILQ